MQTFLTTLINDKVVQANAIGLVGLTLAEIDTIVKIFGGIALLVYTVVKIVNELKDGKGKA